MKDNNNGLAVLFIVGVWLSFTGLAVHHFLKMVSDIELHPDIEKVEEMTYGDS
jgi:hypothetical protein